MKSKSMKYKEAVARNLQSQAPLRKLEQGALRKIAASTTQAEHIRISYGIRKDDGQYDLVIKDLASEVLSNLNLHAEVKSAADKIAKDQRR